MFSLEIARILLLQLHLVDTDSIQSDPNIYIEPCFAGESEAHKRIKRLLSKHVAYS